MNLPTQIYSFVKLPRSTRILHPIIKGSGSVKSDKPVRKERKERAHLDFIQSKAIECSLQQPLHRFFRVSLSLKSQISQSTCRHKGKRAANLMLRRNRQSKRRLSMQITNLVNREPAYFHTRRCLLPSLSRILLYTENTVESSSFR